MKIAINENSKKSLENTWQYEQLSDDALALPSIKWTLAGR